MTNIIDPVFKLVEMSDVELNELLLEERYNKANLRELIRRSLSVTKEYKRAFEEERKINKELNEMLEQPNDSLEEEVLRLKITNNKLKISEEVFKQMLAEYQNFSKVDEYSTKYIFETWKMLKEVTGK